MDIRYPNGEPADLTEMQRQAVGKAAFRFNLAEPVTVHPEIAGTAVMLHACEGLWLGIEPDGYTHS